MGEKRRTHKKMVIWLNKYSLDGKICAKRYCGLC